MCFSLRMATVSWLLLGITGCGKPQLVPVKGVVTLDGKPLANATVLFIAEDADGRDANATSDAEGKFELSTNAPKDGAIAGSYKIVIQYSVPNDATQEKFTSQQDAQKAAAEKSPKEPILPAIYTDPGQTVLKQKIPADGPIKIELQTEKR